MTSYRRPEELLVLGLTLLIVLAVLLISAAVTMCTSFIFVLLALVLAYASSKAHHNTLMERAHTITPQQTPELAAVLQKCVRRLQPGPVVAFVAPSPLLNAYTFGLENPKDVVLYSALLKVMDEDELSFILGHELGHVALGHTWLNSLIGGMAGVPTTSTVSAILTLVFLWWNRTCELSADRAGLLACGSPEKAITALIKLVAGREGATRAGLELAYRKIDAEDDTWLGGLNEAFGTHPMLIRRINDIRKYAQSAEYQQALGAINRVAA